MDPFAKALQASSKTRNQRKAPALSPELEKNLSSQNQVGENKLNPFSQALARTGGSNFDANNLSQEDLERQQEELTKQKKKEAFRKRLHEVNPVDLHNLYSAEAKRTQKKLNETRQMINAEMLRIGSEVKGLSVEIALFQDVVDQGREGIGFREYLDKIRRFIRLLRKQVHSARTWLQTQNARSKKKQRGKGRAGIEIGGQQHEQTKAVFDQMHHEQSTAYSGN